MIYYILLIFATLLYAFSFYFNKKVEENTKDTFDTTILFLTLTWVEVFIVLFIILRGKLVFTPFSVLCASIHSLLLALYTILNLKVLKIVNLSKYSLYTMLGGMLVPTAYGVIFANESVTFGKVLCWIFVSLSLLYESRSGKSKKGELKFLLSVFLINGLFGVISAIHQNSSFNIVGSMEYMSLQSLIILVCGSVYLIAKKIKSGTINSIKKNKAYLYMLGYGLLYGGAEFILLVAIKHIASSVQFPIITGGVIVFSTFISLITEKSKDKKCLISVIPAVVGLIFLIF